MKKILTGFIFFSLLTLPSYAQVIVLQSGDIIEGQILKRTPIYVRFIPNGQTGRSFKEILNSEIEVIMSKEAYEKSLELQQHSDTILFSPSPQGEKILPLQNETTLDPHPSAKNEEPVTGEQKDHAEEMVKEEILTLNRPAEIISELGYRIFNSFSPRVQEEGVLIREYPDTITLHSFRKAHDAFILRDFPTGFHDRTTELTKNEYHAIWDALKEQTDILTLTNNQPASDQEFAQIIAYQDNTEKIYYASPDSLNIRSSPFNKIKNVLFAAAEAKFDYGKGILPEDEFLASFQANLKIYMDFLKL